MFFLIREIKCGNIAKDYKASKKILRNDVSKNYHNTGLYNLSFVSNSQKILMLRRNKEPNKGKLNGFGGKLESFESASQSMLRELREEAGITALEYRLAGLIRCSNSKPFSDYMIFCYLVTNFEGQIFAETEEGRLCWVSESDINTDNDSIVDNIAYFLPNILHDPELLEMNFHYDSGSSLCNFNGKQKSRIWTGKFKF